MVLDVRWRYTTRTSFTFRDTDGSIGDGGCQRLAQGNGPIQAGMRFVHSVGMRNSGRIGVAEMVTITGRWNWNDASQVTVKSDRRRVGGQGEHRDFGCGLKRRPRISRLVIPSLNATILCAASVRVCCSPRARAPVQRRWPRNDHVPH